MKLGWGIKEIDIYEERLGSVSLFFIYNIFDEEVGDIVWFYRWGNEFKLDSFFCECYLVVKGWSWVWFVYSYIYYLFGKYLLRVFYV